MTQIKLLNNCGNIAEADASREITRDHFDKAIDSLVSSNISETLKALNESEKSILRIISDNEGLYTSGELYDVLSEKSDISYASFNRTVDKLEFVRLIDTKYTGKGVKGKSREIILRFNPDDYSF